MDFAEAKELLLFHSSDHPDIDHPKWSSGFLGTLRPYQGLRKENYTEIMEAIVALAPHIQESPTIDREIVSALWAICHLGYMWGVHPEGMLRRNDLITPDDVEHLKKWIEDISYAILILLGGGDIEEAVGVYGEA